MEIDRQQSKNSNIDDFNCQCCACGSKPLKIDKIPFLQKMVWLSVLYSNYVMMLIWKIKHRQTSFDSPGEAGVFLCRFIAHGCDGV